MRAATEQRGWGRETDRLIEIQKEIEWRKERERGSDIQKDNVLRERGRERKRERESERERERNMYRQVGS